MKTHVILLAAALSLASAPTAHADAADDAFLNAVHDRGISMANGDQELIDFAHNVCDLLGDGYSMNSLIDNGELHERNGLSDDDVKFLVKSSAASYCPELIP